LYFDQLRGGENFWQSLNAVKERIANYRRPLNNQKPQLAGDTLAKSLCLNGCFGNLPGVLTMTVENTPAVVQAGEKLDLKVKTNAVGVKVDSMWASVITPQVAAQRTEQGYSRQPEPIVRMRRSAEGNWNGRFDEFSTNGDYVFTFKAKDNKGFISETKPLNMSVASGTQSLVQPRFDFATFTLTMPAMTFPLQGKAEQTYAMNMKLNPDNFVWTVDMSTFKVVTDTTNVALANFNPTTGKIHIPVIELVQNGAVTSKLSMDVTLLNSEGTIQFNTDLASLK
jgi:hypothetical protein